MGGQTDEPANELALLWVLNLSDGQHSLLDIAERAGLPFALIAGAADALLAVDLLREQAMEAKR
jgi:aminopeptidase-like protein